MNTRALRIVGLAFLVVGLVAALPPAGHAQFVLYDDFQNGIIDPEKWRGFIRDGTAAGPGAELIRRVEDGRLHLSLTSYGDAAANTGNAIASQGLFLKQVGQPGGSGFITGLKTTITVLAARAPDCSANPENSGPRVQINGTFFNDGSSTGPSDRTGDIQVYLILLKNPATGGNTINVGVQRCGSPTCSPFENLAGGQFATPWSLHVPVAVKVIWQEAEQRFRFVANGETKDVPYPAGIEPAAPPAFDFKQAHLLNFVKNCTESRKKGKIEAVFDQFEVRRQP